LESKNELTPEEIIIRIENKINNLPKKTYFGRSYANLDNFCLDPEEFITLIRHKSLASKITKSLNENYITIIYASFRNNAELYAQYYEEILRSNDSVINERFKITLCDAGFVGGFGILNEWLKSDKADLSRYAAEHCPFSQVEVALSSRDTRTRLIAYKRMGIEECMDRMLKDKSKDIRAAAAKFLKPGDPRLVELAADRASDVIKIIARKLDKSTITSLLKNKKTFDNKHIMKILQNRT